MNNPYAELGFSFVLKSPWWSAVYHQPSCHTSQCQHIRIPTNINSATNESSDQPMLSPQ